MAKKQKSIWERISEKYVISVRNEDEFLESSKATLSVGEILSLILLGCIGIMTITIFFLKITGLSNLLVNKVPESKQAVYQLNYKVDSLRDVLSAQDQFFYNIQRVINGDDFAEKLNTLDSQKMSQISISSPSTIELELRDKVSNQEMAIVDAKAGMSTGSFSAPIQGVVTLDYEPKKEHFGIDIAAPKNTAIKSISNGKVLYSSWNVDDGYSMIIAHENGFLSIYKHAEKLLKDINDRIETGDAVGIIGNSGENSTGYHLHFELWKDGVPQNPNDYFKFD